MKVKTGPPKSKPFKKSFSSGSVQKKKFSKPTGGVLKNVVKITDAFEVLKSGNDLTGISCSQEPKSVKKSKAKDLVDKKKVDGKVIKNQVDIKKDSKGKKKSDDVVVPKQKKQKKEKIDGAPKVSLKSKVLDSTNITEVNTNDSDPKLDITKVIINVHCCILNIKILMDLKCLKVEAAVSALFTLIKDGSSLSKNALWEDATPIHLVITAVKLGVGPKRVIRM